MSEKIGIGVLSFAHGHVNAYCQTLLEDEDLREDVELVACWDDDVARGQAAAERFGMRFCARVEEVLGDSAVNAVIITCETHRHAEMTLAAADAGKHILCQKPMALTLEECDSMAAAVERAGVKFMMAHQMRHDPANATIKRIIESGSLGRISLLRRRHCIPVLLNDSFVNGPTRWHFDREKNRGMWMDDASHATDFIAWMLGRPISVMAEIQNTVTDISDEDTGVAIYRFEGGTMAVLVNSSVTLAGENTCEIYGDAGVLIQNHDDAPSTNVEPPPEAMLLKMYTTDNPQWRNLGLPIPATHGTRIANVPKPFIACLKNDTPPPVTAADGRLAVEMVLNAYRSAQEGQRVLFE